MILYETLTSHADIGIHIPTKFSRWFLMHILLWKLHYRSHQLSFLDTKADSAVWDTASSPWLYGARPYWYREVKMHSNSHEGHDRHQHTTQRVENESKSHHCLWDVRSTRCSYKWLDWWDLLNTVEAIAQGEERRAYLAGDGWPSGHTLDREPQLCSWW